MKTNALRVSYLRFHLCLVLLFAVGNVIGAENWVEVRSVTKTVDGDRFGPQHFETKAVLERDTGYTGEGVKLRWYAQFLFTATASSDGAGGHAYNNASGPYATFNLATNNPATKYYWDHGGGVMYAIVSVGSVHTITAVASVYETGAQSASAAPYTATESTTGLNQLSWGIEANAGPNPVNYQVWRNADNVPVANVLQAVGAAATVMTITVPDDKDYDDYTLKVWIPGLFLDGGGRWHTVNPATTTSPGITKPAEGAETVFTPTVTPTSAHVVPSGTTVSPTNTVPAPTPPVQPNVAITPTGTGGVIWSSGGSDLTAAVFREGVDAIVKQQVAQSGQLGTIAALADDIQGAKGDGETATAGSGAQGSAAKTAAEALFPTVPGAPTAPGAGAMPSFGFSFGGAVVNINPFTSDRFETVAAWFRASVAWLTLVLLGWWLWSQMGEWIRGFSTVQQARGNAVVGGTGAQATALIAAGAITVIIVTGITGLVGWASGDVGFSIVTAALSTTTPAASMAADLPGAFWILNKLFPLSTMFAALIARVTFNMYASGLFAGVMAAIRFVVP